MSVAKTTKTKAKSKKPATRTRVVTTTVDDASVASTKKAASKKSTATPKKTAVAKKTKAATTKKERPAKKGSNYNIFAMFGGYLKGAWFELTQVRWPNRRETWGMTLAVIAFSAFFVLVILGLDAGYKYLFDFILKG